MKLFAVNEVERRLPVPIFEYSDYRLFLRDYYQGRKQRQPQWGYQSWANNLGLRSKSALAMIVSGQRNPGRLLVDKLALYFELTSEEREYFLDLVDLEKSKNGSGTRTILLERLARKRSSGRFEKLDLDEFTCLSGWQFVAIRELSHVKGFRWDPQWISHQLEGRISPSEVRHAILLLSKLGIVVRTESGGRELSTVHLTTDADIASEAIKRFHENILELARKSLRSHPVLEREMMGVTLAIRQKDLPDAKKMLRRMAERFADAFEKEPGERVYQLELAFFPLSRKRSGL